MGLMTDNPNNIDNKWQLTLKLERGNGKAYVKIFSAKSTKIFIYVTFVGAIWTASAFWFLQINRRSPQTVFKESAPTKEPAVAEPFKSQESTIEVTEHKPVALSKAEIQVLETPLAESNVSNIAGFTAIDNDIKLEGNRVIVQISLKKTTTEPEIEGKLAGILILRNIESGSEKRLSSRPELISLTLEKSQVQASGLYFKAKNQVVKQLFFDLPENIAFDELSAELSIVSNKGFVKKVEIGPKKILRR
jgi:hypothetical protein